METNNVQTDKNIETIIDVDSFEDNTVLYNSYDEISDTSSHYDLSQHQLDDESIITINEDENSSLSEISNSGSGSIEIGSKQNQSNLNKIPEQRTTVDNSIKEINQQMSIKQKFVPSGLINTSTDRNLLTRLNKNDLLNLEKIAIPKKNMYNGKYSVLSSKIKKLPSISVISPSNIKKKPFPIITKLQPIPNISEVIYNTNYYKQKQLKTISSNESKLGTCVIPDNGVNYTVKKTKRLSEGNSLNYNSSTSQRKRMYTTAETSRKGEKLIAPLSKNKQNRPKKISKFIAQIQELPDGKYKMIPTQGKVPIGLRNVFKRNSHFIKQKISKNPDQSLSTLQQKTQVPSKESYKLIDFGNSNISSVSHTDTHHNKIENYNSLIDNGEIKTNNSYNERRYISSNLILSPKSKSLQSDDQQFNITEYGKSTNNNNFPLKTSINKKKHNDVLTEYIIHNDDSNGSIATSFDELIQVFPANNFELEDSEIEVISDEINEEIEEISDEESHESGRFISCHYQYCHTLVYEPELIDDLYCSLTCKNLHAQHIVIEDETTVDIEENINLSNIENITHKRKRLLTSPCPKKIARRNNNWNVLEQYKNTYIKIPIVESESSEQLTELINISETEDDDDFIDLRSLIGNEDLLHYMEEMQFRSAPKNLFDKPFPNENNLFKYGQKLEGIDPEHEALFCVMTVVQVCGYRIKLHFDGFPIDYDFWVNADCPDLFYPGWCKQNARILQPPKNYKGKFSWTSYLNSSNTLPAPLHIFASSKIVVNCKTHLFQIGDKLEALDILTRILPKQLMCVATVADIIGNRIRIHYDGWADDYDCWMDITSTNIHPVGWCKNNGRSLAPPSGYNDFKGKKPFSWTKYLTETNSKPVPEEAFVRRPLRDFVIGMMIEVVDIVNPSLIRIAEILDIRGDELKILYDGFSDKYAYWIEDDSPDIHPVGWSIKTNHPIEIPADIRELWTCGIIGCNGKGNTNCLNAYNHVDTKDCPYEFDFWETSVSGLAKLLDRLNSVEILKDTAVTRSNDEFGIKNAFKTHSTKQCYNSKLCNEICLSFELRALGHLSMAKQNRVWTRQNAQLGIPTFNTTDARNWSILEVATYVDQVVANNYSNHYIKEPISISKCFLEHEIDGDVFLMLTQDEILRIMKIPFGHAIKICSAITMLRQRVPVFDWIDSTTHTLLKMNTEQKKF